MCSYELFSNGYIRMPFFHFFFFNNYDFKQFLTICQNVTLVNHTFTDRYSAGLHFFHVDDQFQNFAVGDGEGEIRST